MGFFEHGDALARIDECDLLRRGDDDGAGQRYALGKGELRIARAGRHVHHQHIEFAPVHIVQHLHEGALHHGAAPDHRRVFFDHVADGHGLDAVILLGLDLLAVAFRFALEAHHARDGGAVNIGVEKPDLPAEMGEGECQIDCDGGFADAAFAGSHGDDRLHAGDFEAGRCALLSLGGV